MANKLTKTLFPPADASPTQFRISGLIFLVASVVLGALGFGFSMSLGQMHLLLPLLLIPMIVWLVGAHRVLWGGAVTANRWLSAGRIAVTAIVGYVSLMAISGLVGVIAGLITGSA